MFYSFCQAGQQIILVGKLEPVFHPVDNDQRADEANHQEPQHEAKQVIQLGEANLELPAQEVVEQNPPIDPKVVHIVKNMILLLTYS